MKLTVLGSGSPEAYARRASSGYLLEIGTDKILFDVGGGVFDNLLRAGLSPSGLTHLYLSHLHSDHMMDYARLVHARWDEGGPPLRVWAPEPFQSIHDKLFGPEGVFATDLNARCELPGSREVWVNRGGSLPRPWPKVEITTIDADHSADHGGWHIRAGTALHAQPFLDCLAFRVEAGGKSFVYSGDTGITEDTRVLFAGADVLLHWCYRLKSDGLSDWMAGTCPTPSEIADMAVEIGVGKLLLTHFRKHMDTDFDSSTLDEGALKAVNTQVVEDLDSFDI